jgi:hypothetical protein
MVVSITPLFNSPVASLQKPDESFRMIPDYQKFDNVIPIAAAVPDVVVSLLE